MNCVVPFNITFCIIFMGLFLRCRGEVSKCPDIGDITEQ